MSNLIILTNWFVGSLDWSVSMGKKKREHIVFDQTHKSKKSIPFSKMNKIVKHLSNKKYR